MPEATIADLIAKMFEIRERRQAISKEDKELIEEWEGLQAKVLDNLDGQGATRVSSALGTAVITEDLVPQVNDWDALYSYIRDNDAFHMLQRRVATAAYRELREGGHDVPGIAPLKKRSISLRAT